MNGRLRFALPYMLCALLTGGLSDPAAGQAKPEGEMRWALYVTLPAAWFDPGEVSGQLTPFWVLYALHDALVKPMPGNMLSPSLAESWTVSADQRVYEFKLREGLKFHNGDSFTAEDVKFSFYRAKGSKILRDKVQEVVAVEPTRVRFVLHEPWPDFMTFYGTILSGAGWIVPKTYVERVGDDGFKKAPVGLGPYKFVSYTPGVELVMEANEGYWRKIPSVKRLVFKTVPESTTRLAMLKRGEVDIAYLLEGPQAQEVKRDPKLETGLLRRHRHLLSRFPRPMGPEIAVARPARAAGRELCHRPTGAERGRDAGGVQACGQPRPADVRVRAADRALSLRPGEGEAAARRSGLSERLRRRRAAPAASLLLAGRGDRRISSGGRNSAQDAGHRARRLHGPDLVEEGERALRLLHRALRQRGFAPVRGHPQRRSVGVRRLSRHRRALQAAGRGDGSQEAGGNAAPDPAARARARQVRSHLPVRLAQRHRSRASPSPL